MPRTNQDGKDVKLVLSWLCKRVLTDTELAQALDMPTSNYSRRKDAADYPTFEELDTLAHWFKLDSLALQITFGYLPQEHAALLDDDGLRQYVELGGGEAPSFIHRGMSSRRGRTPITEQTPSGPVTMVRPVQKKAHKPRMRRRPDAPPGP